VKIEISEPAALDIERIDVWWRGNRDRKDLFREELFAALGHIGETPELATIYDTDEIEGTVRYVQLEKTSHQLYYVVEGETVLVLAIWSTVTGQPPRLR
jgi:plasmid stabilization system protein ParE